MFALPDDDYYAAEEKTQDIELNYSASPQEFFDQLVNKYNRQLDKLNITKDLITYVNKNTSENVFILKKLMDIEFSKKISCNYHPLVTSQNYGCDLREIIYNRDGSYLDNVYSRHLIELFDGKQLRRKVYHIMTDVDDTLFAHTGLGVAGADASWSEKVPYPGIILFYQLFYNKLDEIFRYSTVLSATPGVAKSGRMENQVLKNILKEYSFIQGSIESKRELLTSGVVSGFQGFTQHIGRQTGITNVGDFTGIHHSFGDTKFKRYQQYKSIFPEYKIIFLGDNGQGDVDAGKQMLEEPGTDTIVCIHKIINGRLGRKESSETMPGLYFFQDYYQLSKIFQNFRIFDENDVQQIGQSIAQLVNNGPSGFSKFYTNVPGVTLRGGKKTRKHKNRKTRKHKKRKTHKR